MKNKNITLGLLAILFAIGSAFASKVFVPGQGHLKLKYVGEEEPVCALIGDCPGGSFICKARVNGTDYELRDSNCVQANYTGHMVGTIYNESIQEVVED